MLQRVSQSPSALSPSGPASPSLDSVRIADLQGLGRDAIHDLWRRLHRKPPPKGLTGDLLVRALAYRIQIERHGGLSRGAQLRLATAAREATLERARAGQEDGDERAGGSAASRTLRPGTRLVREWQGEVHEVIALADGFLWNGASYRSLSVIAKAITGTSWNGWIFFGVERKKPKGRPVQPSIPVEAPLKGEVPIAPAGPVAMLGPTAEHPELPPAPRPVRKQPVPPTSILAIPAPSAPIARTVPSKGLAPTAVTHPDGLLPTAPALSGTSVRTTSTSHKVRSRSSDQSAASAPFACPLNLTQPGGS